MTPEEPAQRIVELDELLVRPGTYFNPQTEVVVVVDDSVSIDQEVFNMEAYEGADWVHISDEVPVDSDALDAAMQEFQANHHPAVAAIASAGDDELELEEDALDAGGDAAGADATGTDVTGEEPGEAA